MSTLVLFARAPEKGRVKTRLARAIGEDHALDLYQAFLEDCVRAAADAASRVGAALVLAIAGDLEHPTVVRLSKVHGADRVTQAEGDLGVRMNAFIERYLASGPVCLVGSDAPTLSGAQIARAFDALGTHEVVIGPGLDGGYWLIGARRAIPELLTDMPWSTDRLLRATLERLVGRSAALLEFFYDVDGEDDLDLLRKHLGIAPAELAASTRRALAALS